MPSNHLALVRPATAFKALLPARPKATSISKSALTAAIAVIGIALGGLQSTQAANLQALEANSGQCGTQGVCFVPDSQWNELFSQSSYDDTTDTVIGSGTFTSFTPATGSQAVYVTSGDGLTVIDILKMTFTDTGVSGTGGGTIEGVTASWQASDGGAINLGAVPFGGISIAGDGSLQDVTPLLAGQTGFPLGIEVQARDLPTAAPEPVSIALIGVGLAGLGAVRRRRRQG